MILHRPKAGVNFLYLPPLPTLSLHNLLLATLHPVQRLRKIRAQILGGLNAARHSHQAVGYAYGR